MFLLILDSLSPSKNRSERGKEGRKEGERGSWFCRRHSRPLVGFVLGCRPRYREGTTKSQQSQYHSNSQGHSVLKVNFILKIGKGRWPKMRDALYYPQNRFDWGRPCCRIVESTILGVQNCHSSSLPTSLFRSASGSLERCAGRCAKSGVFYRDLESAISAFFSPSRL